jgi:MFS transporter, DHA3 family, macrolide efflux protein
MGVRHFRGMAAFWVIWGGLVASFTGSGLTRFGLSVWMYQETRDAQAFALLLFFGVLPLGVGALIAGPLVDRLDRRRVGARSMGAPTSLRWSSTQLVPSYFV